MTQQLNKTDEAPLLLRHNTDGVAHLTLNRPEARNAIDPELAVELAAAWEDYRDDQDLRCAIITGAGDATSQNSFPVRIVPRPFIRVAQRLVRPPNLLEHRVRGRDPVLVFIGVPLQREFSVCFF